MGESLFCSEPKHKALSRLLFFSKPVHDERGRQAAAQQLFHPVHVRCGVVEECMVAGTEIVEPRLAVRRESETILGALAVAGEEIRARQTLLRQRSTLALAKGSLPLPVNHLDQRRGADVAKQVLREDKVVARVDVAVLFECQGVAASLGKDADPRRDTDPVGQRGIENLNENLSHIVPHPFVEDRYQKTTPLRRRNRIGRHLDMVERLGGRGERLVRIVDALHGGRKLNVPAAQRLEEAVKLQRAVGIEVVHNGKNIERDIEPLQKLYAPNHVRVRAYPFRVFPVSVVLLRCAVDGDTYQEVVLLEEATPLLREQSAVRLQRVVYVFPPAVLLLQRECLLIKGDRTEQRLSAVPGEKNVGRSLRADVLLHEKLQHLVAHRLARLAGIQTRLLQIVAVLAPQVARGTHGFYGDIIGMRKGGERHKLLSPAGKHPANLFRK